jgi:hypothetical protein
MPIVCWTIIHRAAASAASNLVHAAHPLRHFVGRGLHHVARHAPRAVGGPARTWSELVCKTVLPAAVAGGGLVAPVPANAPPVPSPPPGYIQPAPVFSPWSPLGQTGFLAANLPVSPPVVAPSMTETASALPPLTPETTFPVTPTTPTTPTTPGSPSTPSTPGSPVPEPGSLSVLLGGVAVLLLMRQLAAASQARTRRSCGGAHQSSDPSSA